MIISPASAFDCQKIIPNLVVFCVLQGFNVGSFLLRDPFRLNTKLWRNSYGRSSVKSAITFGAIFSHRQVNYRSRYSPSRHQDTHL